MTRISSFKELAKAIYLKKSEEKCSHLGSLLDLKKLSRYIILIRPVVILNKHDKPTKLIIDESLERLQIHIAPVDFEVDRIVLPVENMKADRVRLLIIHSNPEEDAVIVSPSVSNYGYFGFTKVAYCQSDPKQMDSNRLSNKQRP